MGLLDYFRRPPKSELDSVREQLELVEARTRLAALAAQESIVRDAVSSNSPFNRNSWYDPVYREPTTTDVPLFGLSDDDLTLEDLGNVRNIARRLARRNKFAINILKNIINFTVSGDGMAFTAATKDEASAPLVAAVQDVLDEFAERTLWNEWQQEIVRRTVRDGEAFIRLFEPTPGQLDIRAVEPDWVHQPEQEPADVEGYWHQGVCFDREDRTKVVGYWVVYPEESGEFVPAAEVIHFKANVDRNVPRGLSDFFAAEDDLVGTDELLRKTRIGEGVRAAIAGFWNYENATAAQVATHVGQIKDAIQRNGNAPNPITGKTDNYQYTAPGTIIHTPKGKMFQSPPSSPATSSQVSVVQACLRAVAARWNMPEFMISADASNNNYASILVSGGPFCREIRTQQGYYRERFLIIQWRAVEVAAAAWRIAVDGTAVAWRTVEALTEIQAEPPAPELANELEQSQVDSADMMAGVMSKQTRAMRRGLDWEQEQNNLAKEPRTALPGMADPFAPHLPDDQTASTAAAPKPDQQADAVAGNELRTTVGGLNAVASLQSQYYAGNLPREAAIANVKVLLGFTDAEAASLFPEIAPVKLTPDDAGAAPEITPPTVESVQEAEDDTAGVKAAKNAVAAALKSGKLKKKPCAVCGDKDVEAHHKDYRKPLNVSWLCRRCHDRRHGKDVSEAIADTLHTKYQELESAHSPDIARAVIGAVAAILTNPDA